MLNSILAILSGRAFIPDPESTEETISQRFRKRKIGGCNRLLVISAGKNTWRVAIATFDRAGAAVFAMHATSPSSSNVDALSEWLRHYAHVNGVKHAAIGVGFGFVTRNLDGVPRHSDLDTQGILRSNPAKLMGESDSTETTVANLLINHPLSENSCIHQKNQSSENERIINICLHAGLQVCRVVGEQAQLIELVYASGFAPNDKTKMLLITQPSSFILIPLGLNSWNGVVYDPAIDDTAVGTILDATGEALLPGQNIAYIDAGMLGMDDVLAALAPHNPYSLYRDTKNASFAAIILH